MATTKLLDQVIPAFAKEIVLLMLEAAEKGSVARVQLTEHLHRRGINMRFFFFFFFFFFFGFILIINSYSLLRYLGRVCHAVLHLKIANSLLVARLLYIEACARAVKNLLFEVSCHFNSLLSLFKLPLLFPHLPSSRNSVPSQSDSNSQLKFPIERWLLTI